VAARRISTARRWRCSFYLDLDITFKGVNGHIGHTIGDKLPASFAEAHPRRRCAKVKRSRGLAGANSRFCRGLEPGGGRRAGARLVSVISDPIEIDGPGRSIPASVIGHSARANDGTAPTT